MKFTAYKCNSPFRSIITLLFKFSVGFQLEILCLSLAGIVTYLFTILLGLTYISNQVILFWLLLGTGLAVFTWIKFRDLLFDGGLIKQTSSVHESAFVAGFIISIVIVIKILFSQTIFESGDFSSFVRLTSQFTQFRGPWETGAFQMEFITPDRIQLHRIPGTFYPQATHFIIAMIDYLFNLNDLPRSARFTTALLCFTVLPLLLILLGQCIRPQNNISNLISLSFIFSILLTFDLRSGQIPAAIGMTLMIFVLVLSLSLSSFRKACLALFFGGLLLMFVHPSSSVSLYLLYTLTLDWKLREPKTSRFLSKILRIHRWLIAIILVAAVALIQDIIILSKRIVNLVKFLGGMQVNLEYHPMLGVELVFLILRFVLLNFCLFGYLSPINIIAVALIFLYIRFFGQNPRERIRIPELLIALIVLSSSLGGASGVLSLAKIPSIFWYSTPSRLVHLWTICIFHRICKGNRSRSVGSVHLSVLLFLATSAYAIHLIAIANR